MIPERYYYTIGEVSEITETKPHILRYWESQFKLLRPARRYSGHRKYTQREIDLINRIRYLILERKFTLFGAKREINRQLFSKLPDGSTANEFVSPTAMPLLKEIQKEIQECMEILST